MKQVGFVILCFLGMVFGIHLSLTWQALKRNKQPESECNCEEIDSIANEIKVANKGSHMVLSRMHDDTVYVPMSNQELIDDLANRLEIACSGK